MNGLDILNATTSYYKLTRLNEIKCIVIKKCGTDDQILLDVEIDLRKNNPKLLATIYSKELWVFSIDGLEPLQPSPNFDVKWDACQTIDPKSLYKSSSGTPPSLMSLLSMCFLKAFKRLLITNLTSRQEIIPFGTGCLLPSNQILEIEPRLINTGEVMISLITRDQDLWKLDQVSRVDEDVNEKYAIYLIPSGIRAYLGESSIDRSTVSKPQNYENIVNSLKYLHNLQIDPDRCSWIKLIPNLAHLNGMTSQISDYFKPVKNVKSLVWPLELCIIQEARFLKEEKDIYIESLSSDPLSLVDQFVSLKASSNTKTPSTVPTANNTPMNLEVHPIIEQPSMKTNDPSLLHISMNIATSATLETSSVVQEAVDNVSNEDWNDLDEELFGDGEVTDTDFNFFDDANKPVNGFLDNTDDIEIDDALIEEATQAADLAAELELLSEENSNAVPKKNEEEISINGSSNETTRENIPKKDPYDIPLTEMTLLDTPPYSDPGAPLPFQSPKYLRKRSIFSPLNFNPIIKANVDNKYANGGKFFVASSTVTSTDGNSIPTMNVGETLGQDEGDVDDDESDDEGSADYEDDSSDNEVKDFDHERLNFSASDSSGIKTAPLEGDQCVSIRPEPPQFSSPEEPDLKKFKTNLTPQVTEGSVVPDTKLGLISPDTNNGGVPNTTPFILRSIPIHSIPPHIFKDNPTFKPEVANTIINELLKQLVWDDAYIDEIVPGEVKNEFNSSESVERAIAQLFPEVCSVRLSELTGIVKCVGTPTTQVASPLTKFKTGDNNSNDFTTTPETKAEDTASEKIITDSLFSIAQPKLRVKRLNQELSVNASALYLWNLMSFNSLNTPKDFRVLLFSPTNLLEQSEFFLTSLSQIYEKCSLGSIEHVQLSGQESTTGLLPYDSNDLNSSILNAAKELNELYLKNSDYKEILVVIPNFEDSVPSVLNLIQQFEQFKSTLLNLPNGKTLPIKIALKIIPSSFISNRGVYSVVSINKLTRLSLSIYNGIGDPNLTYTTLSISLPDKIEFEMTKNPVADGIMAQDSFIHLAYERSIDKEWCVAAWTNDNSSIKEVRAWNCTMRQKKSLENVMNEIWKITVRLASHLKGKKHLVLTRLDGMIPDDELLQWKRLSSQSRDLILIVVSVDQNSKLLLKTDNPGYPINKIFNEEESFNETMSLNHTNNISTVGSSSGLTPSAIFTPQTVNSPDLFTITKTTTINNNDSPSDIRGVGAGTSVGNNDDQNIIVDISDTVYGLVTDCTTPLANTPTRLAIKTGYLIKPIKYSKNELSSFEVSLLSCPPSFSNDDMIKKLLIQFRNLNTIGELFSVVDPKDSLLPWHVEAVKKAIRWLVHLRVEIHDVPVGSGSGTNSPSINSPIAG